MNEDVVCHDEQGVARLTLNRPSSGNSLSLSTIQALHSHLHRLAQRKDIGTIVLSGVGQRIFCAEFPDLHVVHMHRDPRTTVASGASLNATLHAMHADAVDLHSVGAQWLQRMAWTTGRAMTVREDWADDGYVTDIHYDDAIEDPIGAVAQVYDAVGLPLTSEAEAAMRHWLEHRPREAPRRGYDLATYGLTGGQVDEHFAGYNNRFRQGVGHESR